VTFSARYHRALGILAASWEVYAKETLVLNGNPNAFSCGTFFVNAIAYAISLIDLSSFVGLWRYLLAVVNG
jgi:hypothetical protein